MVDAQCDKLETAVRRTKTTFLATIDVLWQIFYNRESGTKFHTEVLRYSNFLTAQYREKSYLPKFSSVYSAISTKHGLMTDTLMDTATAYMYTVSAAYHNTAHVNIGDIKQ